MPLVVPVGALASLLGAARDAMRAWRIAPPRHSRCLYVAGSAGGWNLRARRPFGRCERLRLKARYAVQVFTDSLRVRRARHVVIPAMPSEGLLANVLHVLEVVHRVRREASVRVDWVLTGTEPGFRYGEAGDDLWARLFDGLDAPLCSPSLRADQPLDLALWGTGRDRLRGRGLRAHRDAYSATVSRWMVVADDGVRARAETIARQLESGFAIGVHRRTANARVANLQIDGKVPRAHRLVQSVRTIVRRQPRTDWVVYLATDDADVVVAFRTAFGSRLIVQEDVQRTTADAAEVHYGPSSFANAQSVLVDTIVLSRCDVVVHASSSVSTIVALMNPQLELVRVRAGEHDVDARAVSRRPG